MSHRPQQLDRSPEAVASADGAQVPDVGVIRIDGLTKTYGGVRAVDNLTFSVGPGRVTGFLGPNGAGKSTTIRMLVGLAAPTSGTATIGGMRYADLTDSARQVGVVLETSGFHPGRSARAHLRAVAAAAGIEASRVEEVAALVDLSESLRRRVGGFSLGMRQRLSLATALLGDPQFLILDEPTNGLDPHGLKWLRRLLRRLADGGRTVLVASHVLSEVQQMVDDVVIVTSGRLAYCDTVSNIGQFGVSMLATPNPVGLLQALAENGIPAFPLGAAVGGVVVGAHDMERVAATAAHAGVALGNVTTTPPDLEEAFLTLTGAGSTSMDERTISREME